MSHGCWRFVFFFSASISLFDGAAAREPTEFEQFNLELINRARLNPTAEVARLSQMPWGANGTATPSLNEGLPPGTISPAAKQPLAFNPKLLDDAGNYANTLLAAGAFSHTHGGTTPTSRAVAAGYTLAAPWGVGENLAVTASSLPNPITAANVESMHNGLFVDAQVSSRGHRVQMLGANYREVGIGVRSSASYTYFACCPHAVLAAQDFAYSAAGGPFLTGVAYRDVNDNQFYTPGAGEALGGLLVEVLIAGTQQPVASTTTFASGGYTVGSLASGMYDVRFSGPAINETYEDISFFGGMNIKLDAVDPGMSLVPGDADGNGEVDRGDVLIVSRNFGLMTNAGPAEGDFDGDHSVTTLDLNILKSQFGTNAPPPGSPTPGATALCEPSTIWLGLLATLGGAIILRRHRGRAGPTARDFAF